MAMPIHSHAHIHIYVTRHAHTQRHCYGGICTYVFRVHFHRVVGTCIIIFFLSVCKYFPMLLYQSIPCLQFVHEFNYSQSTFRLYMYLTGLDGYLGSHFNEILFPNDLTLINPLLKFLPIILIPLCLFFRLCLIKVDLRLFKTDTSQLNTLPQRQLGSVKLCHLTRGLPSTDMGHS